MSYPLFVVDVFAEEKYAGNQLAVIVHDGDLTSAVMQRVARETNFSETTFVGQPQRADGAWDVRIFTPMAELPFAGHPTLGTAWVLRHLVDARRPHDIVLQLPIGPTPVRFDDEGDDGLAWLTAPLPTFGRHFETAPLADLLGLTPADIDLSSPIVEVSIGPSFTFVPIASLEALARARFRTDRHEVLQDLGYPPCLFLFCRATTPAGNDLRARLFATPLGIVEDPATGSANACLAAYLLRYVEPERSALAVRVEQGVEMGRPSLLHLAAERRGDHTRIEVGGHVVLSLRGELV